MKIAIIWASKGLGLATVKRALQRWHNVITLSRSKIGVESNEAVQSIYWSALHKEDVEKTIQWADAIIVALGNQSLFWTTLFSDFAHILVDSNPQIPCIVVTGFWSGESWSYNTIAMKILFTILLKKIYQDKTKMEEIIAKSSLQWTIVRPWALTDDVLTEHYRIEKELFDWINIWSISRNDVADFLVKEAENQKYLHQYPDLSLK